MPGSRPLSCEDTSAEVPLYEQLRRSLERRIASGELAAGDQLPTEAELGDTYGASRVTVREAVRRLADANLVVRKRGAGTFVQTPLPPSPRPAGTGTVSLVLANAQGGFMADLIKGAEQVLYRARYRLSVTVCHNSLEQEADRLDQLIEHPADGVILLTVNARDEQYPNCARILALQQAGIPVLLVDRYIPQLPVGYVVADDEGGMYALTQHVLGLGYSKVGYLDGSAHPSSLVGRRQGFVRAMAEHGVRLDPALMLRVPLRETQAGDAVQRSQTCVRRYLDDGGALPSVMMASTTSFALGALRAFYDKGIRVPEDVAVATWADDSAALAGHAFLGVWQAPVEAMGRRVAEELLKHIEQGQNGEGVRIKLPGKLATGSHDHERHHAGTEAV